MHRDDGFGFAGDGLFQSAGIQRVSLFVDIDKDRFGSTDADGFGSGHERARRRDYFVAWSNPQTAQRQPKGFRPVAQADRMPRAAIGSKILFKTGYEGTPGEGTGVDNLLDGAIDLLAKRIVLRPQVQEWNMHSPV
jgi:hypothetical protein